MVPVRDRAQDLRACLQGLAVQHDDQHKGGTDLELRVLVVDNASKQKIDPQWASSICAGASVLRLETNAGGSGGFNAGIRKALEHDQPDFVWLLDSDASPLSGALASLVTAMEEARADIAGSTLIDPSDHSPHECGGFINPSTGELQPAPPSDHPSSECDYVAACSMLVRPSVFAHSGLLPDTFLAGDDAMFCQRARSSGSRVVRVPSSRVLHPRPTRMRTTQRYYAARSSLGPAMLAGVSARARVVRVVREACRAASQELVGARDLAALHMAGLRDAVDPAPETRAGSGVARVGQIMADAPAWQTNPMRRAIAAASQGGTVQLHTTALDARTRTTLARELREAGCGDVEIASPAGSWPTVALRTLARWAWGAVPDVAVVDARARPSDWIAGHTIVTVSERGWRLTEAPAAMMVARAGLTLLRCIPIAARAAISPPEPVRPDRTPRRDDNKPVDQTSKKPSPSLSVVIATHNRPKRLRDTLDHLRSAIDTEIAEIIVVDNGGGIASDIEGVRVVGDGKNTGVDAYNTGVAEASAPLVLVLDDDAWPEPESLQEAIAWMRSTPDAGAVSFRRRHPSSGSFEWPGGDAPRRDDTWPDLGPCNLVRRAAWHDAGGYEPSFFLYRNDTDFALSLLARGWLVRLDQDWTASHDSDSVGLQPSRWFQLATRNWVWMCRRHGRGVWTLAGTIAGWAWSHKRAGISPSRHWSTLKGLAQGVFQRPPPLAFASRGNAPSGRHLAKLLRLKLRLGRGRAVVLAADQATASRARHEAPGARSVSDRSSSPDAPHPTA